MDYILHILVFILIYSSLVQSLNLIMGYAGVVSMCHAVFCGIGAYTAALISIHLGYNFLIGTVAGFVLAGVTGAILALPSLRVRDEYLIVFTIGFQMVMFELMLTARSITEGQGGITNIPAPSLLGFEFNNPSTFLPLALAVTVICFFISWRVVQSPFGRVLKAVREDESACRALGKNSLLFKVLVFALGGGIAAVGGSTLAYYLTFISPFSFTVDVSIFLIVMVVMGGAANFWGPLVGSAILVGLPEALRFIPGTGDIIDVLREFLYGIILMLFMLFRPQGILPEYLGQRKRSASRVPGRSSANPPFGDSPQRLTPEKNESGPALEVQAVCKSFGGLQAVKNVSLTLPFGEITVLIGPNGCGKTTLFNLITGDLSFNQGTIRVRGKDMTHQPPYRVVKNGLARSWQDVRIFSGMTVMDNVLTARPNQSGERLISLFFNPWRVAQEESENLQKAFEYLTLVGLAEKADQLAGNLSPAEQKLVAIARLLATECPILLLDEPTAALDMESVKRVIELIKRIAGQRRKTILLVEHNLDVVRGLAEKAYFMSEGEILAHGQPQELMADPKLAEVYFGID
jgi:branched-chain amino acid transport system permease protein